MTTPITITGNIVAAPELKFLEPGKAVASFTVAHNRYRPKGNGEFEQIGTDFYRCTAWDGLAENVAESLAKGVAVIVVGTISAREYEKDGQKRTAWEVRADHVGPSLRSATASVTKVERQSGQAAPITTAQPQSDPWATAGEPSVAPF